MQKIVHPEGNRASRLAYKLRKQLIRRPRGQRSLRAFDQPYYVAGLFATSSGIGQSARACWTALSRSGLQPKAINLSRLFNQSDLKFQTSDHWPPINAQGTLILHLNAPETERALFGLQLLRGSKLRVIGYWAWELPVLPKTWVPFANYLDEIWTPSDWVTNTIAASILRPVKTVPHYVPIEPTPKRQTSDGFRCLIIADGNSSFYRKNVLGSLEVFERALGHTTDAFLTIKTKHLQRFPKIKATLDQAALRNPRISIVDGSISQLSLDQLQQNADVLISMHRSEGFGLHLAHAMSKGKVVIATKWSGNLQFMNDDNSILIPAMQVPRPDDPVYGSADETQWADPDLSFASRQLKRLYESKKLRTIVGRKAKDSISQSLGSNQWRIALGLKEQL